MIFLGNSQYHGGYNDERKKKRRLHEIAWSDALLYERSNGQPTQMSHYANIYALWQKKKN